MIKTKVNLEKLFSFENIITSFGILDSIINDHEDQNFPMIFSCLNPHSCSEAFRNDKFKTVLRSSYNVIDGIGFMMFARMFYRKNLSRITGLQLTRVFLNMALDRHLNVAFVGSDARSLSAISKKVHEMYSIRVTVYAPPFKSDFNREDISRCVEFLRDTKADIIFMGLTAPKQEIFTGQLVKDYPEGRFYVNIGAVFDYLSGNLPMPPKFIRNNGLEWLFRFFVQPKHIWKRIFVSPVRFIWHGLKAYFSE